MDNLVEEMAEDPNDPNAFSTGQTGAVYDNYKFLTVPQLKSMNLDHLIGRTNLLRPYMHGYFVAQQLYDEARLITNPYIWEEERAKRVKGQIDKERESRIRGKKKANVKVNKKLAEKLMHVEEKNERRNAQRVLKRGGDDNDDHDHEMQDAPAPAPAEKSGKNLLADSRFSKLFEDEDFAIDENSREFKLLNPSTVPEPAERKERGLTAVEQEDADGVPNSSSDDSDSDESEQEKPQKKQPSSGGKISTSSYKRTNSNKNMARAQQPQMRVSSSANTSLGRERSFGSRAQNMQTRSKPSRRTGVVGEQEVTFMPSGKSKKQNNTAAAPAAETNDKGSSSFRAKERRSASGNTFRDRKSVV